VVNSPDGGVPWDDLRAFAKKIKPIVNSFHCKWQLFCAMFISYNIKWYTGLDGMCFYNWYIAFGTVVAEQRDNAEKATLHCRT